MPQKNITFGNHFRVSGVLSPTWSHLDVIHNSWMSSMGSLDPFCRWEDWEIVSGSPQAGFFRPATRAHMAQTWSSAGRFHGMPLCGISEQKFTLLPFINQSDSFNHGSPGGLSYLSHKQLFNKCFRKAQVSSSVAWGDSSLWLLSCFLIKGTGGRGRKDLYAKIPKLFLHWLFELAKFLTRRHAQKPFRSIW